MTRRAYLLPFLLKLRSSDVEFTPHSINKLLDVFIDIIRVQDLSGRHEKVSDRNRDRDSEKERRGEKRKL